ncbi:ribonuclease P protein component [Melaminivora sp.]|uniref:ribonuclease P protein component n=1 Tax=Melaminivora sp. TaxID=1933032 RepID=UPI0028ACCF0C|nr:ribonuclease P protein component [Melaminivora sp.]
MHRLKTRPQFQAVLAGGTVARTAHFALHRLMLNADAPLEAPSGGDAGAPQPPLHPLFLLPAGTAAAPWLGAMVPKRWARRAVTRNAIKRQIRAVAHEHGARLPVQAAHVVRLRATFDRGQFVSASSEALKRAVRAELEQLFARATRQREAPAP